MRIVGVTSPASEAVSVHHVAHGDDPRLLWWQDGYVVVSLLSTRLDAGEVVVTALLRTRTDRDRPPRTRRRGRDLGLDLAAESVPVTRQRVAAYAVVVSDEGLLGTQCSTRTAVPGIWQLPGGGLDAGETPAEAVVREISEETAQSVELNRLIDLQSDHWVGRAPDGTIEDFHALRLFYTAWCPSPTQPVVLDVGGTTARARWVQIRRWRNLTWTSGAQSILDRHLRPMVTMRRSVSEAVPEDSVPEVAEDPQDVGVEPDHRHE